MKKILYVILLSIILTACHAQKEIVEIPVPVETIKTEYIHDLRIDSVFVRDSIDRYLKGDTMYIYKESIKYKYVNNTDTVYKDKIVPKVVNTKTIEKVEVNRLKWWQTALMWVGGVLSIIIAAVVVYKLKKK